MANSSIIIVYFYVFMHISLTESTGMALVEAMAIRIPIVGGNSSAAAPWVLKNGNCGIISDIKGLWQI